MEFTHTHTHTHTHTRSFLSIWPQVTAYAGVKQNCTDLLMWK